MRYLYLAAIVTALGVLLSACPKKGAVTAAPPPPHMAAWTAAAYCKALQPYLDNSDKAAGLNIHLECLGIPGVADIGFYGTRAYPKEARIESCLDNKSQYANLIQPGGNFNLSYDQSFAAHASGSGHLTFGPFGSISLSADASQSIYYQLKYIDAHVDSITDLKDALANSHHAGACFAAAKDPKTIFTPMVLKAKLDVKVRGITSQKAQLVAELAKQLIVAGVNFTPVSTHSENTAEFVSHDDLVVAVAIQPFTPSVVGTSPKLDNGWVHRNNNHLTVVLRGKQELKITEVSENSANNKRKYKLTEATYSDTKNGAQEWQATLENHSKSGEKIELPVFDNVQKEYERLVIKVEGHEMECGFWCKVWHWSRPTDVPFTPQLEVTPEEIGHAFVSVRKPGSNGDPDFQFELQVSDIPYS